MSTEQYAIITLDFIGFNTPKIQMPTRFKEENCPLLKTDFSYWGSSDYLLAGAAHVDRL